MTKKEETKPTVDVGFTTKTADEHHSVTHKGLDSATLTVGRVTIDIRPDSVVVAEAWPKASEPLSFYYYDGPKTRITIPLG